MIKKLFFGERGVSLQQWDTKHFIYFLDEKMD